MLPIKQFVDRAAAGPGLSKPTTPNTPRGGRFQRHTQLRTAARQRRIHLAAIAQKTKAIVFGSGKYVVQRSDALPDTEPSWSLSLFGALPELNDIGAQVELSKQSTEVIPHHSEPLSKWRNESPAFSARPVDTTITFTKSPMVNIIDTLQSSIPSSSRLAVISPACPTRPGGSWLTGADDTETQLARATSLSANLESAQAASFYTGHRRNPDHSGLRDHSMIYAPNVLVLRPVADSEELKPAPTKIDILSVAAVHSETVKARCPDIAPEELQAGIHSVTHERLARSLRLLADRGVRHLVLPAFGCEAGQGGDIGNMAAVFAELLICGDDKGPARFKNVFESITFSMHQKTLGAFKKGWELRVFEDEMERALSEEE
jgi:uncharacterized protein (TIGR02452 family)